MNELRIDSILYYGGSGSGFILCSPEKDQVDGPAAGQRLFLLCCFGKERAAGDVWNFHCIELLFRHSAPKGP